MVNARKLVHVTAETDLPALLDDAVHEPVLLERGGELFRLARADDDMTYEPDSAGVRRMLEATAGSWRDLNIDQIVHDVYEARQAGSRPPERP